MRRPDEDDADAQTVPARPGTVTAPRAAPRPGERPPPPLASMRDAPSLAIQAASHEVLTEIRDDVRASRTVWSAIAVHLEKIGRHVGRVAVGCLLVLGLVAMLALALGAVAGGRIWWAP